MAGEFRQDELLELDLHPSAPIAPDTGTNWLYPKSDNLWYTKTPAGVETPIRARLAIRDWMPLVSLTGINTLVFLPSAIVFPINSHRTKIMPQVAPVLRRTFGWIPDAPATNNLLSIPTGKTATLTGGAGSNAAATTGLYVANLTPSGTSATITLSGTYWKLDSTYRPHFMTHVHIGTNVTNGRLLMGLFNGSPTTDTFGVAGIGFRFSPNGAGDTTWHTVVNDGGGNSHVQDTGVTVSNVSTTWYRLEFWIGSNGHAYFSVNGATPIEESLYIASSNTGLTLQAYMENVAGVGFTFSPQIAGMFVSTYLS